MILSDCEINVSQDIAVPPPLILKVNQSEFLTPLWNDTSGLIRMLSGESLQIYCPNGVRNFNGNLIVATCLGGKSYRIGGEKYKLKDIRCTKHPWITLQPIKHSRSYCRGNEIADIGFKLAHANQFVKTMTICHAIRNLTTFYTIYDMKPYSVAFQKGVSRLGFIQAREFNYSTSYNKLYSRENQRRKLEEMLDGDAETSYDLDDYLDNDRFFLSRGHLGSKADFFWANQQRSTFFYVNAAPQWQSINGGNWQKVEDGIRRFVASRKINATIISGTHKVLKFPTLQGNEFYLGEDGLLPVPQFFYKIVYDEGNSRGIVFISINNPHLEEDEVDEYLFCKNVIDEVNWISLKPSLQMGFIFACDVNEFVEIMDKGLLPALAVKELLK